MDNFEGVKFVKINILGLLKLQNCNFGLIRFGTIRKMDNFVVVKLAKIDISSDSVSINNKIRIFVSWNF